jgi:hypothetical protein
MSDDDQDKPKSTPKTRDAVYIRNFSKAIFFYPLFFYSIIAWIVQYISDRGSGDAVLWVAIVWLTIFFANIFVIAFDFSTGKFLIMFFVIVTGILTVILLYTQGIIGGVDIDTEAVGSFDIGISSLFYGMCAVLLGVILLFVVIETQFKYIKIEQNEIYLRGISGSADRYPTKDLRIKKKISDVFEYLALRAGTLVLEIGTAKTIQMDTVANINAIEKHIDELLSTTKVTTT